MAEEGRQAPSRRHRLLALAWLNDQAPFAARVDHLFAIIADAILARPGKGGGR